MEERLLAQQQRRRLPVVAARALRRRLAELRRLAHVGDLLRDRHLQPRERELVEPVLEVLDEGLVEQDELRAGARRRHERLEQHRQLVPQLAAVQLRHLRVLARLVRKGGALREQEVDERLGLGVQHFARLRGAAAAGGDAERAVRRQALRPRAARKREMRA